jgi:endonuclease/exonuclease/phosphatase family metal-dependent hydrolase
MAGYRALLAAIAQASEPLVAGFDSNHWSLRSDLALSPPPAPDHAFEVENRFFSSEPQHTLRDALLDYLRASPKLHEAIRRERPNGPLETTYIRGNGKTPDRFDYIFISQQIRVKEMTHDWAATDDLSDHALVAADLAIA